MKLMDKITKGERNIVKNVLENDNGLKITSLVVAIFMFISVNQIGNPLWDNVFSTTDYIQDVPLTVKYDESKYVVTGMPQTLNVSVAGSENNVQSLVKTKENLTATLPLNYKNSGEYTINSSQVVFNNNTGVKITPNVQNFDIKVQTKEKKNEAIEIKYINADKLSKGVLLSEPKLSTNEVSITGGNDDISKVVSVGGMLDLSSLNVDGTKTAQNFPITLVPYNKEGDVVSDVSLSPASITVTQNYTVAEKEVPVKFSYLNEKTDQYVSKLCPQAQTECSGIAANSVKIYGNAEEVKNINQITYKVNLNAINKTDNTVEVTPVIPSGVYLDSKLGRTYTIELKPGTSKLVQDVNVEVKNLASEYEVSDEKNLAVDVRVTGNEEKIKQLSAKDIKIYIDMSDINKTGTLSVPLNVEKIDDVNVDLQESNIDVNVEKGE